MFVLLAVLCAATASPARTTSSSDRSASAGRDYVRLADWARINQYTVRWLVRDRTLQLSNRWARMVFNVDPRTEPRRAEINGVEVWLSFPILYQKGAAYIARGDLEQTLTPVLSPTPNRSGKTVKTICLDPGHGGKDPGFRVGANEEQKYTLLLAQEVRDQLKQAGFNVIMTRSSDTFVARENRPVIARKARPTCS